MNTSTFNLLCDASQLSFTDSEQEIFIAKLSAMIDFADEVRQHETTDCGEVQSACVSISDLREDTAKPSVPAEILLGNTESLFDCCVIPKLMD
jgi:Asp-tRNA(Asn)/Glu-tRNA(Gln) amidotransferase C subunit